MLVDFGQLSVEVERMRDWKEERASLLSEMVARTAPKKSSSEVYSQEEACTLANSMRMGSACRILGKKGNRTKKISKQSQGVVQLSLNLNAVRILVSRQKQQFPRQDIPALPKRTSGESRQPTLLTSLNYITQENTFMARLSAARNIGSGSRSPSEALTVASKQTLARNLVEGRSWSWLAVQDKLDFEVKNDGLGHHSAKMYQEAPLYEILIIFISHFAEHRGQLNHGLLRDMVYLLAATIVGALGQQAFAQHLFYYISSLFERPKTEFSAGQGSKAILGSQHREGQRRGVALRRAGRPGLRKQYWATNVREAIAMKKIQNTRNGQQPSFPLTLNISYLSHQNSHIFHSQIKLPPIATPRKNTKSHQLSSFQTRYFSNFSITFLISSLFLILYEQSMFIPFAYQLKGRVWQACSSYLVWQQREQSQETKRMRVLKRKNSQKTRMEMSKQKGRYNQRSSQQKLPLRYGKDIGRLFGQMSEFPTNIHSPIKGPSVRAAGKMTKVNEVNSYPRPSILVELYCSSDRSATYRLTKFKNPKGSSTGMPAPNIAQSMMTRQKLAASWKISNRYAVISSFICFCRILPSCSSSDFLPAANLAFRNINQTTTVLTIRQFTQMTETFLYQTVVKLGQKEMLLTLKKLETSVEIMVMKEMQLLGWKPKMLAQTSKGIKIVLKIRKRVQMDVRANMPEDFEAGRTNWTKRSTISPKRKLVKLEVKITAYWMA